MQKSGKKEILVKTVIKNDKKIGCKKDLTCEKFLPLQRRGETESPRLWEEKRRPGHRGAYSFSGSYFLPCRDRPGFFQGCDKHRDEDQLEEDSRDSHGKGSAKESGHSKGLSGHTEKDRFSNTGNQPSGHHCGGQGRVDPLVHSPVEKAGDQAIDGKLTDHAHPLGPEDGHSGDHGREKRDDCAADRAVFPAAEKAAEENGDVHRKEDAAQVGDCPNKGNKVENLWDHQSQGDTERSENEVFGFFFFLWIPPDPGEKKRPQKHAGSSDDAFMAYDFSIPMVDKTSSEVMGKIPGGLHGRFCYSIIPNSNALVNTPPPRWRPCGRWHPLPGGGPAAAGTPSPALRA